MVQTTQRLPALICTQRFSTRQCGFAPAAWAGDWWTAGARMSAMVQYRRARLSGGIYFLTAALDERGSTLLVDHVTTLRLAFRLSIQRRPFRIDAVCILPDHMHLLMTLPPGDADFSGRMRLIKAGFTRLLKRRGVRLRINDRGEHALWQRRFWEHLIRDDDDYARHVDYIHYNPVKHRLVTNPADWPWSSYHRFVRNGGCPLS